MSIIIQFRPRPDNPEELEMRVGRRQWRVPERYFSGRMVGRKPNRRGRNDWTPRRHPSLPPRPRAAEPAAGERGWREFVDEVMQHVNNAMAEGTFTGYTYPYWFGRIAAEWGLEEGERDE